MSNINTDLDAEETERTPRKSRQPKADRKVCVSRIVNGKPKEFGSFPESVVGEPLERRLLPFLTEMNAPAGDYKIDIRKPNGHFEKSFDVPIPETEQRSERIIDIEPESETDKSDFDAPEYDMSSEIELRAELIALRREMKELRERERQDTAKDSQSEMLAMMRESSKQSEKSFQQGLQMAQMIMSQQQPKENPSELMLSMLRGTLEVQRGVRQLSEEIGPQESASGGSFMGDAARLIDSVGKNAGTFAPIIMGALGANRPTPPPAAQTPMPRSTEPTTAVPSGELGNLAEKIRAKKTAQETEAKELTTK